ncbi:MAG TPA: DNA internalization-related competence protein ComEC/Rec2 [Caldisericia bacterium]|nr:DNA internalization-related competence protein ComEC/Rec2 [Caldisericia bacterium]HPF49116.1 DNA internalization-related competence protein ComEC/Rec2 [Caldisericia bacterium]HPI83020.1 DNA internalization-related competence protein ComEC/Rec2 [Caldisericia bacterium]HPQ92247.1 DNA internalization-related competence protein ComEC/Rec2 [Caldisericia bacterium]HRV74655.1 DNA internalization-related competence protein ComEC/Rec2 [Caldisericia bacterium]
MSPIVASAISMVLGVAIGLQFNIEPVYIFSSWFVLTSFLLLPLSYKTIIKYCCIFLAIGITVSTFYQSKNNLTQSNYFQSNKITLSGVVESIVENKESRAVFEVILDDETSEILGERHIRCYSPHAPELAIGDSISVVGYIGIPQESSNPGQFDFKEYLANRGIRHYIKTYTKPEVLSHNPHTLRGIGTNIRNKAYSTFDKYLPERSARILDSMMYGRADLPEDIERLFQRTGTYHLLAVSGFHVSIIVFSTFWLLMWIFGSRKGAILGSIAIGILYASIASFTPSVSRALVMVSLILGSMLFGREYSKGSGLSGALIILLLVNPSWLYSPGFQLSFVSSFALFIGAPLIFERIKQGTWYTKPLGIFLTSALITVLTLPIQAIHFHTLSVISPIANIFALPLSVLIVPLGALSTLFAIVFEPLVAVFAWLAWPVISLLSMILSLLSKPFFVLSIASMPTFIWIPYYLSLIIGYNSYKPAGKLKGQIIRKALAVVSVVFLLFSVGFFVGASNERITKITFLDVGHGDSCFIRTSRGSTILVDAGGSAPYSSFDPGASIVVPYIRQLGINSIDIVIATHQDQDHVGGLLAVLNEFTVGKIFVSGVENENFKSNDLENLMENLGIEVITPPFGHTEKIDDTTEITFLGITGRLDESDKKLDTNNSSVVVRIVSEGVSVLLTGDIQAVGMEFELMTPELIDADVVKLPHHGGWCDEFPRWTSAVSPGLAINSDSAYSGSGAHSKVEETLKEQGVPILSTARCGAITLNIIDGELKVETFTQR